MSAEFYVSIMFRIMSQKVSPCMPLLHNMAYKRHTYTVLCCRLKLAGLHIRHELMSCDSWCHVKIDVHLQPGHYSVVSTLEPVH